MRIQKYQATFSRKIFSALELNKKGWKVKELGESYICETTDPVAALMRRKLAGAKKIEIEEKRMFVQPLILGLCITMLIQFLIPTDSFDMTTKISVWFAELLSSLFVAFHIFYGHERMGEYEIQPLHKALELMWQEKLNYSRVVGPQGLIQYTLCQPVHSSIATAYNGVPVMLFTYNPETDEVIPGKDVAKGKKLTEQQIFELCEQIRPILDRLDDAITNGVYRGESRD